MKLKTSYHSRSWRKLYWDWGRSYSKVSVKRLFWNQKLFRILGGNFPPILPPSSLGGSDVNDSYGRRFLSLYSWWSILCLVGMHKKTELNFLSIQSNFPHPSQKYFEQNKEMTFDRKLANVTDPVIRGLYYPSTQNLIQKSLHEITVNSQS